MPVARVASEEGLGSEVRVEGEFHCFCINLNFNFCYFIVEYILIMCML